MVSVRIMNKYRPSKAKLARAIRRRLRQHLHTLGFIQHRSGLISPRSRTKDGYRALHRAQRTDRLRHDRKFVKENWPELKRFFADGNEVVPEKIEPLLDIVEAGTWKSRLFRLACLTWSVPVSQGYGRRIRFLVWDKSNQKLMGIIALGDPVFNLRVRDRFIGWSVRYRQSRLVNVLDAYVLGAIPPYNLLLGGKLVACLVRTQEVRDVFRRKYGGRKGLISKRRKNPSLVAVTTTSALGPSAVFDRLKLGGVQYFKAIGFTDGWGHFHIPPDLFELTRQYLKLVHHRYADGHQYGNGPNWKLRVVRQAFTMLKLNDNVLNHGIAREVFYCPLASNSVELLSKRDLREPRYENLLKVSQVGKLAVDRWVVRRAASRDEYRQWRVEGIAALVGAPRSSRRRVDKTPVSQIRNSTPVWDMVNPPSLDGPGEVGVPAES